MQAEPPTSKVDLTDPAAIAALADDPKVAAAWRVYQEARTMHRGGYWPGGANNARTTVEMAKAAWQKALREAAGYKCEAGGGPRAS